MALSTRVESLELKAYFLRKNGRIDGGVVVRMICIILVLLTIAEPVTANLSVLGEFVEHWLEQGECEYDLNGDNGVNFVDFVLQINRGLDAALVEDIDFVNKKNKINHDQLDFVRNSIAYNKDGAFVADGVMRTDFITVASPVEYSVDDNYAAVACDSNYVYSLKQRNPFGLFRSQGAGAGWELIRYFPSFIQNARVTENGTLLVACRATSDGKAGVLWRRNSDDSWTEVVDPNALTPMSYIPFWGWTQLDGRIFFNEYGPMNEPNNPRCVYMSEDDGITWTKIHNPDNVTGRHCHTIVACYVDGEFRVYCSYGDGGSRCMYYLTEPDDGGTEWNKTEVVLNFSQQNTTGIWVPEQNCIIWGADGFDKSSAITWHNLADDSFKVLQRTDFQWEGNASYNANYKYLTMGRYGSIGIAPASNNGNLCNHPYSGIWISDGFEFWAKAVRYQDGEMHFAGIGPDGNIWLRKGMVAPFSFHSQSSLYFPIPRIRRLQGALIERASSNIWHCDSHPPTIYDARTVINNDYIDDRWDVNSACSRWLSDSNGDGLCAPIESIETLSAPGYPIYETMPDMDNGDMGFFTFWVKGRIGDGYGGNMGPWKAGRAYAKVRVAEISPGIVRSKEEEVYFWPGPTNDWQRVVAHVTQDWAVEKPGSSRISGHIVAPAGVDGKADVDLLIDGITLEKAICPAEWAPQDRKRQHDVLSYEPYDFPEAFTDIFTVASRFGSYSMGCSTAGDGQSYIYLKSYAVDSENFFAVVYDTYDNTIKLVNECEGANSISVISTKPVYLFDQEAFTIGVTRDGAIVNLYVWAGGEYQTTSGTITNHPIRKTYWGCHPSGSQGGSLVFVRDRIWNEAKSAVDVKKEMQWPEPVLH